MLLSRRPTREKRRPAPVAARTPQQARAHQTVDAILTAAKTLLVREGVEATTTNAIARLAGVSIGSLYQYFPSRDALFEELSRRHVARALALIFNEVANLTGVGLREGARRMISLLIEIHRQDPEFLHAIEASHPALGARAQLDKMDSEVLATARAYLERHRAELVVEDLDRAAFIVVSVVQSVTHDAARKQPELLAGESMAEDLSRMVLGYLTGEAAPELRSY